MPIIARVLQNTGEADAPDFEVSHYDGTVDLSAGEMVATGFRWSETFTLEPQTARELGTALHRAADEAERFTKSSTKSRAAPPTLREDKT